MEGRPLDQVAVREARKRAEAEIGALRGLDEAWVAHLRLILRALDEGREASAPFAAVQRDYVGYWGEPYEGPERLLGRIAKAGDEMAPVATWADLRRLAAWSETVSEPEGKNDAPR